MPKMGDGMEEATLLEWLKKEGEPVSEQEPIASIETEKSTIDIVSFFSGRLSRVLIEPGQTVPVGTPIAVIDTGDGAAETDGEAPARAEEPQPPPQEGAPIPVAPPSLASPTNSGGRVKASPLARKIAQARGVDLSLVRGTGPNGRVVEADVEAYLRSAPDAAVRELPPMVAPAPVRPAEAPARGQATVSEVRAPVPAVPPPLSSEQRVASSERELSGIRKTIARRLVESKQSIPHFYVTSAIDMRAAAKLRDQINALRGDGPKLSYNDLIVRACALALRRFPTVNAHLVENRIRTFDAAHIGIAVALPEGLIVPVLRDADRKSLSQIGDEVRALAERARAGQLTPEEYSGGTFTISNLGMYDVDNFSGIINPPECALLAVGAITEAPMVVESGLAVGLQMRVTISADHRVIDGAVAAQFLQEVKRYLQEPLLLV
jgi:pyruvate dehydrogenase E2 component (dihydrolipoamide acetyltransferase)